METLRTEMRCNQAELKNARNEIQSKLDTIPARVNGAEGRINYL